jgi:hypothetical protein
MLAKTNVRGLLSAAADPAGPVLRCSMVRMLTISLEMISVLTFSVRPGEGGCPIENGSGVDRNGPLAKTFIFFRYHPPMFRAIYASRTHCRNRVSSLL